MATDDEVKTDAGGSTLLPGHLETDALAADGVVSLHHALLLEAENLIEIDTAEGDEGAGGIGGRPCELDVIARHEAIGKIAVRRVDGSHSLDAQFIHETTLERAVHALAAPPGLGRVGEDVFDAEPLQGTAHLGGARLVDGFVLHRSARRPARAIAVEGLGKPVVAKDRP